MPSDNVDALFKFNRQAKTFSCYYFSEPLEETMVKLNYTQIFAIGFLCVYKEKFYKTKTLKGIALQR